jgi:cell shape-determining protein MreD
MRWFLVAILAYVALVIQTSVFIPGSLALPIDGHQARPDLALLLGLFLALFYKPGEMFLVGWCLGLASDFSSVGGRLGLLALAFSLVLPLFSFFRASLPRTRIITHFLAALAVVFVVHLGWYLSIQIADGTSPQVFGSAEMALLDALYSAILAPYLFWAILKLKSPLGISVRVTGKDA